MTSPRGERFSELRKPRKLAGHPERKRCGNALHQEKEGVTIVGKLAGKIALVTGGNSGIGLATAKRFVDEGAYVFITGRRDGGLAAPAKEIGTNLTAPHSDFPTLSHP